MTDTPEESAGYHVTEGDLAGRIACARMLRCAMVLHSEQDARRARELIAKIGGEVPPIRIRPPRRQAA